MIIYNSDFIPLEIVRCFCEEALFVCNRISSVPEAALGDALRFMTPYHRNMLACLGKMPGLMILAQMDCHSIRMTEMLERKNKHIIKINIPADFKNEKAFHYYENEIKKLVDELEIECSLKLKTEKLKGVIYKANQVRALLRKIDILRKDSKYSLQGSDFINILHNSMSKKLDDAIVYLESVHQKLKECRKPLSDQLPRILVIGRVFHMEALFFLKMIEEAGASTIHELLDEGLWLYDTDVSAEGDLIKNLAKYYYKRSYPINYYHNSWKCRYEYIKATVRKYKIDGIIWNQLSFDEIYDMEYLALISRLAKDRIPFIRIETSYEESKEELAGIETRIESFVSMLSQRDL